MDNALQCPSGAPRYLFGMNRVESITMKKRSMEQILLRNSGITIVEGPAADRIQGDREITLLWRQLLWEFADGANPNKNMIRTLECFNIIKIPINDCNAISPEDQRIIRRVIGQMAKRSHVFLLIDPGADDRKDHGGQVPLLDNLHADTLREGEFI